MLYIHTYKVVTAPNYVNGVMKGEVSSPKHMVSSSALRLLQVMTLVLNNIIEKLTTIAYKWIICIYISLLLLATISTEGANGSDWGQLQQQNIKGTRQVHQRGRCRGRGRHRCEFDASLSTSLCVPKDAAKPASIFVPGQHHYRTTCISANN